MNKDESMVITLRSKESLCLDLDDAYRKIEKLNIKVFDLEDTISTIEDNAESEQRELDLFNKVQNLKLALDASTALNRSYGMTITQLTELKAENYELRNRRD